MQDQIKTEGDGDCLNHPTFLTFRHEVKKVLNIDLSEIHYSPPFQVGNITWVLAFKRFYSLCERQNDALSIYIKHLGPIRKVCPYVCVEVTLSVISPKNENAVTKDFAACIDLSSPTLCGFEKFMFWKDLISIEMGFMKHGNIIIEVKMAANPPQPVFTPKNYLPYCTPGASITLLKEENDMLSTDKENIDDTNITNEKEQLSLQERGEKLLTLGIGSNCKILVGKDASQKLFEANTLFLAQISPVLENMFYGKWLLNSPVLVPNVRPDIFHKLLLYSYTFEVPLNSQEEAAEMYHVADMYLVKELKEKCLAYVWPTDHTNIWIPLRMTEMYDLPHLRNAILEVMNENIQEVVKAPEFLEISQEILLSIVQMYSLPMNSELELFSAVLKWARAQCHHQGLPINGENLRAEIGDALCYIRFFSMTPYEFSGEPASSGVLTPEEQLCFILAILNPKKHLPPASLCTFRNKRCSIPKCSKCSKCSSDARLDAFHGHA